MIPASLEFAQSQCRPFTLPGHSVPLGVASSAEIRRAQAMVRRFTRFLAWQLVVAAFHHTVEHDLFGHAIDTSYHSDKFDRIWRAYKHKHGAVWPEIHIARTKPGRGWTQVQPPRAFAVLGIALDMQVYTGPNQQQPMKFNWDKPGRTALLCGDGRSHRLYIVPTNPASGFVLSLYAPGLRIRPSGIHH